MCVGSGQGSNHMAVIQSTMSCHFLNWASLNEALQTFTSKFASFMQFHKNEVEVAVPYIIKHLSML